jgi:2-keto-4-pentenoate hydratase
MSSLKSESARVNVSAVALTFVAARRSARALRIYPGEAPKNFVDAYGIQDEAIGLWPDEIQGWKVGRLDPMHARQHGQTRLFGPIFKKSVVFQGAGEARVFAFDGGFGAVEGEIVFLLSDDAPTDKLTWTTDEAAALIGDARAAVEIASSPFRGINENGPFVTISDFGNNHGLIVGDTIQNWRSFDVAGWRCITSIDGVVVGEGAADSMPGGPVESLRALLENAARRGKPLRRGMAISTGAISGVHEVFVGQRAEIRIAGARPIRCAIAAASPQAANTIAASAPL